MATHSRVSRDDCVLLHDRSTVCLRRPGRQDIAATDPRSGRRVGTARYLRSAAEPQVAELSVAVSASHRRLGLGTELLARLTARARAAGIYAFTAIVPTDDSCMIGFLSNRKAGVELVHASRDTVEYEISLTPFAASLAARLHVLTGLAD